MTLDLSSLETAINAMDALMQRLHDNKLLQSLDKVTIDGLKSGMIQHFEFTYELCWKFIQRWIKTNKTPEEADHPRTRKELFRIAAKYGLITHPEAWFKYGDARNLTAHTYDEATAQIVYAVTADFLSDAKQLLEALKQRNDWYRTRTPNFN